MIINISENPNFHVFGDYASLEDFNIGKPMANNSGRFPLVSGTIPSLKSQQKYKQMQQKLNIAEKCSGSGVPCGGALQGLGGGWYSQQRALSPEQVLVIISNLLAS